MGMTIFEPPAVEPVSLAEMKKHLRVDHNDDDDYINTLIMAARQMLDTREGWLGRTLITQTWDYIIDTFPPAEIFLPFVPVQSIEAFTYYDPEGISQTVSPENYVLDKSSFQHWIYPLEELGWPTTLGGINNVSIRCKIGYGDTGAQVPAPIRVAIMLIVGDLYENREATAAAVLELNTAALRLLSPYRIFSMG